MSTALPRGRWNAPSREARDTVFMLVLIGWTVVPHLLHLPPWVGGLSIGVLLWRGWLAWRQAALPGRAVVMSLLGGAAVLTFTGEHTLVSKDAGVTLLVVLMALKTLELRARRDALVVFFLGFFLVLTTFFYSQTFLTAVGTGVSVWGWLTALTLAHMPAGRPTLREAATLAGRAALVGTPVMVALFLLFPRIGPLWPSPNEGARSGLSDHLELGSVAELANDDSIALRVRFDGAIPPESALYFRGPVLTDTDGHQWRAQSAFDGRSRRVQPTTAIARHGPAVGYEMTLEPTQLTWLPLLELTPPAVAASDRPDDAGVTVLAGSALSPLPDLDLQWRSRRPISQRVRLHATAWPQDRLVDATPAEIGAALALPRGFFPRTRAWAAQWAAAHPGTGDAGADADAMVASLYRHIGSAGYSYTLAPGAYEGDAVDQFWLDRKAGFCEHFATAFVVVLRAMGIPARVVTGYQGADAQPVDGYVVVRQSNAHAWAEYWRPGRGWTRADPTAAVAPDRIERGRTIQPRPGLVASALDAVSPDLLQRLRTVRELLDNRWNQWVLGYNGSLQLDLLRGLGVPSPDGDDLGRALILLLVAVAGVGAAMAWWDAHRRSPGQRLARRLAQALRPLAAVDVTPAPHESPGAVAGVLRQRFGADAQPLAASLEALERQRYGPPSGGAAAVSWRTMHAQARALAALHGRSRDTPPARTSP